MKPIPRIAAVALFAFALLPSARAEFREFTSAYGQKMKFELVSHNGSGDKVTLRLQNGTVKEDMSVAAFSAADQEFLKAWIKKTPAKIDYEFRFNIKKTRLGGVNNGSSSGTSRTAQWAYEVEVINAARAEVSNLLLKYQLHKTETTDNYYSDSKRDLNIVEGEVLIEKKLGLNDLARFQTKEVTLETIDDTYYGDDKRDTLGGIHIRIFDSHGRMVHEYRSEGVKNATWHGEKKETRTVIR